MGQIIRRDDYDDISANDANTDVTGAELEELTDGSETTLHSHAGGGGSGDVVGPSSATDNAIARFDTTTGKLIQNSNILVSDVATGNTTVSTTSANQSISIIPGSGGDVYLEGNDATFFSSVNLDGNAALTTTGGGDVTLTSSDAITATASGNIQFNASGDVSFIDGDGIYTFDGLGWDANLGFTGLTANRTYTFPNATGTIELEGHTHTASETTDFDTEVSNNTDVAANTAARHDAVTVTDSSEIDFTLTGQNITASLIAGSIDETKLDASTNASLDLADSALQNVVEDTTPQLGGTLDAQTNSITNLTNINGVAAPTAQYTTAEETKLAGIETGADVTDTANVTAAGALMDSEVDADIKTLSLPASTTISTFGASLVDDADAATARTTLGLGSIATQASSNVTITGGSITGITDLAIADGGTGASTASAARTNLGVADSDIINLIYPVGSIYVATVSTNPGTLFGVGTWVAYSEGRVLVGKATSGTFGTGGATGGSETHTLTTAEMPTHSHGVTDSGHAHSTSGFGSAGGAGSANYDVNGHSLSKLARNTASNTTGISIDNAGSGNAHNILQPYIVVYMWERTA